MTRRLRTSTLGLCLAAFGIVGACADPQPGIDAELARDLQLASAQPATPQLNDGPVDAAEAKTPAPVATQQARPRTTPRRTPQRRPTTAAAVERSTPSAESPIPTVERSEPNAESREPRAESRFRGISAGTSFGLSTKTQVCTTNLPGDKIVATVTNAVVGEDGATIPAGSTVVLEVASVVPGDSPSSAQISLRVRSVVLDGGAHPVDGRVAIASELERGPAAANGSDKKKVIGGAIAGAVIGQVLGRDTRSTVIGAAAGAAAGTAAAAATRKYHACLPAGASVRVTTNQPIAL